VFQTLVVSQPVIRVDRRAGLTALFLHVIVIGVAGQLRPRSPAPGASPREPVRFVLTARPRPAAAAASPISQELSSAPRRFAGELLRLPAIPSVPAAAASPPLDLARIVGGGQATPLSFLDSREGDGEVPGVEEVDQAPRLGVPLLLRYPAVLRAGGGDWRGGGRVRRGSGRPSGHLGSSRCRIHPPGFRAPDSGGAGGRPFHSGAAGGRPGWCGCGSGSCSKSGEL
jgi:hypothetical protein